MKQGISIAWLLSAGILAGCSPASKPAGPTAVPVTVAPVTHKDVPVLVSAIGNVRASASVSVKPRIDGQISKVEFKEGDEVKQGDMLFTLDPRALQAMLVQAEGNLARDVAALQSAEADWQRTKELENTKAMSASAADQAKAKADGLRAQVEADRGAVDNAKVLLSYCYIHSPINGRVGKLMVDAGNVVKNNDSALVVVNQMKPIYVEFSVPEQTLPAFRNQAAGDPVKVVVTLPGSTGTAEGELALIDNQVDTTTGTVLLRAMFANTDELLWPGQFVNVSVTLSIQRDAVVVPANAIQIGQKGPYVYVIKPDQTVESRLVVTGEELGDETLVKEGVQPGEKVVTSNHLRLNPGTKVQVKSAEEPAAKKP